jgi:MFS family permease
MAIFLGSYLVNDLAGSPFLVQLVGGVFFAPMFFGGALAGVISDRFERRLTTLVTLGVLTVASVAMSAVVLAGAVETWMVYPFVLTVGTGGVVDLTVRRTLIYDVVGDARITNALSLEALSSSTANMVGAVTGGAIISLIGIGEAFSLIALCYAGAFLLLLAMRAPVVERRTGQGSIMEELREGVRFVSADPALVSLMGVTVLVNLFYFSHLPSVPVFAERLGVSPLLTGLLASGAGIGMVIGSLVLSVTDARRRGAIYIGGSLVALVALLGFAASSWYPLALGGLMVAGVGVSGFAAMQSVLVMVAAEPEMRGRAMGVLSMAIGALPLGMLALGLAAEGIGTPPAVGLSAVAGLAAMAVWILWRPQSLRMR